MRTLHLVSPPAPPSPEDLLALVRQALAHPLPASALVAVTLGVPELPDTAALAALSLPHGFAYSSTTDACEGAGETARAATREEAEQIFAGLVHFSPAEEPPPRLYGGLPFAPGGSDPAWSGFETGGFSLPRWSHRTDARGHTLTVALRPDAPLATVERELRAILAAEPAPGPAPALVRVTHLPYEDWERHIERARLAIRSGRFEKIVAARACELLFAGALDTLLVLGELRRDLPGSNTFLVRRAHGSFVGATPENLFVKRGRELVTHALAGSRRPGDPPLEGSPKDRLEHDLVVRQIVAALKPFASRIEAEAPRERPVRDIVHLETPIRATLDEDVHPLDLVEALHPTPAVGGLPRQEALDWIVAYEPGCRGWYSGVVGWIDAVGDAELAVAIRSGLIRGRQARIFAGAGIVGASDPRSEYDETALKMTPLLRALGVEA